MRKKIWVYGLDNGNEVIRKAWFFDNISNQNLENLATNWKAEDGCSRVFRVAASNDLWECWIDYIKTRFSRNGVHAFAKMVFVNYLETEGTELAEA